MKDDSTGGQLQALIHRSLFTLSLSCSCLSACSLTCKTTKCSKLKSKYSDENTFSLSYSCLSACSLTCKTTKCSKSKSKYSDENTLSLLLPISLLTQSQKCKMFQNIKSTILRLLTHSRKSNTIAITSLPFTESSPL